jgi:hypothetical protein
MVRRARQRCQERPPTAPSASQASGDSQPKRKNASAIPVGAEPGASSQSIQGASIAA